MKIETIRIIHNPYNSIHFRNNDFLSIDQPPNPSILQPPFLCLSVITVHEVIIPRWGARLSKRGEPSLVRNATKCLAGDSWSTRHGWAEATEKKKRRARKEGGEKREQQRQRALLGRTPTGLFQYYARWQVSLCPEWHVISVTSSRFDQVIEFSFSTWPRKIGCRDTPVRFPATSFRSLILLSPDERNVVRDDARHSLLLRFCSRRFTGIIELSNCSYPTIPDVSSLRFCSME